MKHSGLRFPHWKAPKQRPQQGLVTRFRVAGQPVQYLQHGGRFGGSRVQAHAMGYHTACDEVRRLKATEFGWLYGKVKA